VQSRTEKALEFLFKTLGLFLLLELVTLPLRPYIVAALESFLYSFLPKTFTVEWACTGLDEVFLLASALWWSVKNRTERIRKILLGSAILEIYNLARIAILAYVPDEVLHDILFRWGGFLLILLIYYLLLDKEYKQGRGN